MRGGGGNPCSGRTHHRHHHQHAGPKTKETPGEVSERCRHHQMEHAREGTHRLNTTKRTTATEILTLSVERTVNPAFSTASMHKSQHRSASSLDGMCLQGKVDSTSPPPTHLVETKTVRGDEWTPSSLSNRQKSVLSAVRFSCKRVAGEVGIMLCNFWTHKFLFKVGESGNWSSYSPFFCPRIDDHDANRPLQSPSSTETSCPGRITVFK